MATQENEQYIPDGFYVVEDADGERLIRKILAEAQQAVKPIIDRERDGERITAEIMEFRVR